MNTVTARVSPQEMSYAIIVSAEAQAAGWRTLSNGVVALTSGLNTAFVSKDNMGVFSIEFERHGKVYNSCRSDRFSTDAEVLQGAAIVLR